MAFENVGIQIFLIPTAGGFNEILEMVFSAGKFFDRVALFIISSFTGEVTTFAFYDVANGLALYLSISLEFCDSGKPRTSKMRRRSP